MTNDHNDFFNDGEANDLFNDYFNNNLSPFSPPRPFSLSPFLTLFALSPHFPIASSPHHYSGKKKAADGTLRFFLI